MSPTDHRFQAALQAALNRIKRSTASTAERTIDALGSAALSASGAQRDAYLGLQFDFNRSLAAFNLRFGETLDEKVAAEVAPRAAGARAASPTDWQSLSLVQDDEVEGLVSADRLAQAIAAECEWELRELTGYMQTLLRASGVERNPLRPDVIGKALSRAIEEVSPERERRALLARELGRAMAGAMKECYADIASDLKLRGVEQAAMSVKTVHGPGHELPRESVRRQQYSHYDTFAGSTEAPSEVLGLPTESMPLGLDSRHDSQRGAPSSGAGSLRGEDSRRGGDSQRGAGPRTRGTPIGQVDPQMMDLLRRLAFLGAGESGGALGSALADLAASSRAALTSPAGLMAPNQILAHREELRQAATGAIDHMVIDIVGSLFDQILSDPKVPPQMARQIGRLQLPVLRVALGDPTFFSSRRHPVRRFVNRIASLACAFEDFSENPGLEFATRVRDLVQQIVQGDFDQMELYEAKLAELEDFTAQKNAEDVQPDAAALLHGKETQLRLQQRYMQLLHSALAPLSIPAFLRDFLAQVWSQAIMRAVERDGAQSEAAKHLRLVGRELAMSVQPKGSPTHRKAFLLKLPKLMKDLNEGLDAIGWPAQAKKDFFAQLLPAHSESLKGQPLSELAYNLLASEIDAIFGRAVPQAADLGRAASDPIPELNDVVLDDRFSREEAERIGLVAETAVDWDGKVDIEVGLEADSADPPEPAAIDIDIDGLPPADPPEPNRGLALMEQVQIGFAYQMLLKDRWQKVRLSYVSPGRAFFVFTHGKKHQETISMTARMLARMCETERLRPFENAYLIERATVRARKQLAALGTPRGGAAALAGS